MALQRYNGEIVAGSLLVSESRKISNILLQGFNGKAIYSAVLEDNVLQKRSPASAKRQSRLLSNRLQALPEDFLLMIRDGSHEQAIQVLLAAAIIHSRLLGDFIKQVVRTRIKTFKKQIKYVDWDNFFEECKHHDAYITTWSESTVKKIRQVVFRILAEAKIIDSTRSMQLIPFSLLPEVKKLLEKHAQRYALECLEIFQ